MSINALIKELKENNEDFEFYPTTKEMIKVIYDNSEGGTFLDIGCGTCNFKKYYEEISQKHYEIYKKKEEIFEKSYIYGKGFNYELRPKESEKAKYLGNYYVIEKSRILINRFDDKTIVLGTDFHETMLMDKPVDNIFCNPPYSEYEEWSRKIIREGNCKNIYLIIPTRWRENKKIEADIKESKSTARILGSYDFLNSERNARAKVDIIKITRNEYRTYSKYDEREYGNYNETAFDKWFDETFKMRDKQEKTAWKFEEEKKEEIKNKLVSTEGSKAKILVDLYNEEMRILYEHFKAISTLDVDVLETIGIKKEAVKLALRQKAKGTKVKYWQLAFEELEEITERLTSESRKDMLKRFTYLTNIDFNIENIYAVILWVIKNANKYYDNQLLNFFKKLSSPENIKNYKSNKRVFELDEWRHSRFKRPEEVSHYTLDYRIIMTSIFSTTYSGKIDADYESRDKLQDIFTIARNLGFKIGLADLPKNFGEKYTVLYEKSDKVFMEYRVYKNDNMHVKFDIEFARALNVECSRLLGWIRRKEDIQKEFSDELAKGAEKYYKQNYNCLGNNSLLLIDRQTLNVSENESKNENPKAEYKIKDTEIEIKTKDLRYILDAMNMAINQQKETEEIYNKCLNVLQTGNKFIYRQIIVTVEYDRIILTINNKELLNKIASII